MVSCLGNDRLVFGTVRNAIAAQPLTLCCDSPYDDADNVIERHENKGEFKDLQNWKK